MKIQSTVYNKAFSTPDSRVAASDIFSTFKFELASFCPDSWAIEVLDLLKTLVNLYPDIKFIKLVEYNGRLHLVYDIVGSNEKDVEATIRETELKLLKKGVYLESLVR